MKANTLILGLLPAVGVAVLTFLISATLLAKSPTSQPADLRPATDADATLFDAIALDDVVAASAALDHSASVSSFESHHLTPLHVAAKVGATKVAQLLIEKGAPLEAVTDWSHGTPLLVALVHDHRDVAKLLIDRGADIHAEDRCIGTALHAAAGAGNLQIVQLLVKRGLNVNRRLGCCDETPLEMAAIGNHVDILKFLLASGARIEEDQQGAALIAASSSGSLETTKFLLLRGANVNAHTADGHSALWFAKKREFVEVINLLHEHGAQE